MTDALAVRDARQCHEKQVLIDQIRSLVNIILSIHNEDLEDAIAGARRKNSEIRSNELQEAQYRKTLLTEMLVRHVHEHGC